MLTFDHLAIAAESLDEGAAAVEAALGVALGPGGEHAAMGTHNRLLSLGPGEYLEVIAINPAAPAPGRPRWFGLDGFAGATRPQCWIARSDDLPGALAAAPAGIGVPIHFSRGNFEWEMAVPDSGILPFDGLFPALIGWHSQAHPADALPDAAPDVGRAGWRRSATSGRRVRVWVMRCSGRWLWSGPANAARLRQQGNPPGAICGEAHCPCAASCAD